MTPAGKAHPQPLFPTYIGCLETKKDALLLLEGCFRGQLHHSFRGPPTVPLIIRSGSVFIWEQNVSASQHWDDHRSWTILDHVDDFWISSETTTGDGFWKLTLSVLALGRVYHIVSYYCPWDTVTGNLQAPSQDPNLRCMTLRDELASQLTADSPSARSFRLLRGILKVKLPPPKPPIESVQLIAFRPAHPRGMFNSCGVPSSSACSLRTKFVMIVSCNEDRGIGSPTSHPVRHTGVNSPTETYSWARPQGN